MNSRIVIDPGRVSGSRVTTWLARMPRQPAGQDGLLRLGRGRPGEEPADGENHSQAGSAGDPRLGGRAGASPPSSEIPPSSHKVMLFTVTP